MRIGRDIFVRQATKFLTILVNRKYKEIFTSAWGEIAGIPKAFDQSQHSEPADQSQQTGLFTKGNFIFLTFSTKAEESCAMVLSLFFSPCYLAITK